jgi:hypothetical protein
MMQTSSPAAAPKWSCRVREVLSEEMGRVQGMKGIMVAGVSLNKNRMKSRKKFPVVF